jgi:hypothetical protein
MCEQVAPLNLEKLNGLAASDMILLIQDLDRVLRIGEICFERCHIQQYNIHGWLQALLQLRYVEDVVNSYQRWWQFKLACHGSMLVNNMELSNVARYQLSLDSKSLHALHRRNL